MRNMRYLAAQILPGTYCLVYNIMYHGILDLTGNGFLIL